MIKVTDTEKLRTIIGDGVLSVNVVESCCGYALKTGILPEVTGNEEEVEGLKFLIDSKTKEIAPEISVGISNDSGEGIEVKNLAAKSYCGCGRSFSI